MLKKSDVVKDYLDKFPNMSIHGLSKKIYEENKLLFNSLEIVRSTIRRLKGVNGKESLQKTTIEKYLLPEKRKEKYNLPKSIEMEYKPYLITGNKGLIFADAHLPFFDRNAFETMFDYCSGKDLDFIVIDGDFMDCFDISHFENQPDVIRFNDERNIAKDFLKELKRIFPKTKIYYKFGNHEKRFENYLINKAPEIFDCEEFRLEILLDLFNIGIKYIEEERYIDLSGLSIIHGHEYKGGITSPANPARSLFLRGKDTILAAHNHQSSEHTETTITGKVITTWSIGCMCGLHPRYMPLNKWGHGFAIYNREDENYWTISNKRIIRNRVL